MRYKAITGTLGATSLLVMAITTAELPARGGYFLDGAAATVTQGAEPTTMATKSFSPGNKATPPCGFRSQC